MWFYITYEISHLRVGSIAAEEKSYMGPLLGCVSDVLPTLLLSLEEARPQLGVTGQVSGRGASVSLPPSA